MDPDAPRLLRELLETSRRIVVTTHVNPDGDAIGSEIALARYLAVLGRPARIVNADPTPLNLRFLEDPEFRAEVYDPPSHDPIVAEADLVVLLDNSAPDRLGRMETVVRAAAARTLCIDHHPTRGTVWAHNVLEDRASATAAMVYRLMQALGLSPDARTAEALYTGLATDTGFFRFNSTTPAAHAIAGELLRAGVEPARSYGEVYERNSPAYTRLLGMALTGLRFDAGGAIVSVRITREMERACGSERVDTSEMTTPLLAVDGVRVALLFRELEGGRVKVSLRSKGEVDVYGLAAEFGGGGHRNASGIVTSGPLDDVVANVIERATKLLAQHHQVPAGN